VEPFGLHDLSPFSPRGGERESNRGRGRCGATLGPQLAGKGREWTRSAPKKNPRSEHLSATSSLLAKLPQSVLKTVSGATRSWVRIPVLPPPVLPPSTRGFASRRSSVGPRPRRLHAVQGGIVARPTHVRSGPHRPRRSRTPAVIGVREMRPGDETSRNIWASVLPRVGHSAVVYLDVPGIERLLARVVWLAQQDPVGVAGPGFAAILDIDPVRERS